MDYRGTRKTATNKNTLDARLPTGDSDYSINPRIMAADLPFQGLSGEFSLLLKRVLLESSEHQLQILHHCHRIVKSLSYSTAKESLLEENRMDIFEAFMHIANGIKDVLHARILCQSILLLVELVSTVRPSLVEHSLCMPRALPLLIPLLGHEEIEVRRCTLRLLHSYMKNTYQLNNLIDKYIEHGLNVSQKNVQKGCILSLPLLFTQEFVNAQDHTDKLLQPRRETLNLFPLLQCLSDLLVHADSRLFYAIYLAIQRLHTLLGNNVFRIYLQRINQEAALLYEKVQSEENSKASSVFGENLTPEKRSIDTMEETLITAEKAKQSQIDKYDKLVLEQLMVSEDDEVRKQSFELLSSPSSTLNFEEELEKNERVSSEKRKESMAFYANESLLNTGTFVRTKPEMNSGNGRSSSKATSNFVYANEVPNSAFEDQFTGVTEPSPRIIFGLFPAELVESALAHNLTSKNIALSKMMVILKSAPCTQVSKLATSGYMIPFIQRFLFKLIEHPNFKVTLQILEIVQMLIVRLKHQLLPFLSLLVSTIVRKLGDARVVVRQHTIQNFQLLILKMPTQPLLNCLIAHLGHKNVRVRAEIINRITAILLLIPRNQFNMCSLCYELPSLLLDPKRAVRLAALECLAVLGHCLGSKRISQLIHCVRALEKLQKADGVVNALKARLARRDLPRLLPDGSIRFVLNPCGFPGWYANIADADVEWVLQGSSQVSDTPPMDTLHMDDRYIKKLYDQNLCSNKRDSCTHAEMSEYFAEDGKKMFDCDSKFEYESTQDAPPDTGAKYSESTVGIDNLIEKTTINQIQSRELSTGDSEAIFQLNAQKIFENQTQQISSSFYEHSNASSSRLKSRTLSMPAINSAQLSNISETSEFVSLQTRDSPPESPIPSQIHMINQSPSEAQNDSNCSQPSAERLNGISNEIEIKVQKASTISDDSKSLLEFNKKVAKEYAAEESKLDAAQQEINSVISNNDFSHEAEKPTKNDLNEHKRPQSENNGETTHYEQDEQKSAQLKEQKTENTNREPAPISFDETCQEAEDLSETSHKNQTRRPSKAVQRRSSRSISPKRYKAPTFLSESKDGGLKQHQLVRIQPAIPTNANISNILQNVTKTEGPFNDPDEALKSAIQAFTQDAWTTKVEGMLVINRLALFHANVLKKELHTIILALAYEVKNLRSTVARSAILTLADLLIKMKGSIDFEMDIIAQALFQKCAENIQFIRQDIEKALDNFINQMPPVRAALSIIHHGTNHRNLIVRRIAANFLAQLVESMGATKALLGPRDLAESLLPSAAALLMDRDALTRYFARSIFFVLMSHSQFHILLARHVQPAMCRSIAGTLQSIKRRGKGERPTELY